MLSPFEEAILLGIIQGLTEFLPISSDGHLALAQLLLEVEHYGAQGSEHVNLTLSVLLRAGTLLAVLIYFRRRIAQVLVDLWSQLRARRLPARGTPGWDALVVGVATVPTGLMGLAFRDTVARWTESPLATGFGFLITALILISSLWARPGGASSPTLSAALLLGIAQGIAIAPGISRSGCTIVAALWFGMRAERAFELSMLMSVPAVTGAILLETLGGTHELEGRLVALSAGASVAFAVGLVALFALRKLVTRGHLAWFALWILPLALATLALAKALPS
jgi:undecaprenyl-diphosphatase